MELFLRENGARNCSIVGATFCRELGVLEICRRERDVADLDTGRDLAHEAQTHGSLTRLLRNTLIEGFIFNGGGKERPSESSGSQSICRASCQKAELRGRMVIPTIRTGHHFMKRAHFGRVVEKRNPITICSQQHGAPGRQT